MTDPFTLIVVTLATYRLAHVVAGADSLLEGWQRRVKAWAWEVNECGEPLMDACDDSIVRGIGGRFDGWRWQLILVRTKLATLLGCPYCAGFWLALGMLCTWTATWPWQLGWRGWITALGVAGVQSFLTAIDGRE